MDKAVLKKFAIESRMDLMQKMENKIKSFYVDEEFAKQQNGDLYVLSNNKHTLSLSKSEYDKRELLLKRIKELGIEQVIEESAYTWFNRIVAIRYMEINDYLPLTKNNNSLGVRVLSSKDNTPDPEIMKFSNLINPELDIEFNKEKYISLNDDNEKYKYILLCICKKIGKVIPQVFDGKTDYIDLLIMDNMLNDSGFISKIINEIPENNFLKVEIIGWLYQYYNQSEKDRVISSKNSYLKNEIPYVTQLFTPDWIVKYMVENTLGRYWLNIHENSRIVNEMEYYLFNNNENNNLERNIKDIKFIDPCCGSGHILVYAFDVLYQMYDEMGYNKNEIAIEILKNNIYGLDIDDRAGQLSILSILLKAREYDKNIFNKISNDNIHITSLQESGNIDNLLLNELTENEKMLAEKLINNFNNIKEIGSLIKIEKDDFSMLKEKLNNGNNIFINILRDKLLPLIFQSEILSEKYDVIVTNPPYMAYPSMTSNLKNYLNKYYPNSKKDLCTAFMDINLLDNNGYYGMINQHSWMFIKSYEDLRKNFLDNKYIVNMIDLGTNAFEDFGGAVVQTTSFVMKNKKQENKKSVFIDLTKYNDAVTKRLVFKKCKDENIYYVMDTSMFKKVPGYTFDYWIDYKILDLFNSKEMKDYATVITGMTTGNNDKYIKLWYEIDFNKIEFDNSSESDINLDDKYFYPYSKGGMKVKWYGGYDYVVNWRKSNEFNRPKTTLKNLYFKKAITWPFISGDNFTAKILNNGFLWDVSGSPCFINDEKLFNYILGFLNTPIAVQILKMFNPTINVQADDIANLPIIVKEELVDTISDLVSENIKISQKLWDSNELSWNYISPYHIENNLLKKQLKEINNFQKKLYEQLNENEIKINKIFNEIYDLKGIMNIKPNEIKLENAKSMILKFINYFVGCLFGRYSLDKDGLIFAGGTIKESDYSSFKIDEDNIIPITDDAYFGDDIVSRFKNFIEIAYGKETLNENIDFIAETLGKKGTETSEETIRRYFLNDFYCDHIKMYQKKPIYWLFDSGKKNGFKALIYMHRYNENTVPKVRLDYLHRIQTTYEKLLTDINYKLTTDLSMTDKKEAQKRQVDLNNKLTEIKEYDEKIAHIANQRINIDLDDGVTVNYAKFADILAKIK